MVISKIVSPRLAAERLLSVFVQNGSKEIQISEIVISKPEVERDWVEGQPVTPLEETVEYMRDNLAQFQPAFEILDEMYDELNLDISYSEKETV